jgi:hypothetical protein
MPPAKAAYPQFQLSYCFTFDPSRGTKCEDLIVITIDKKLKGVIPYRWLVPHRGRSAIDGD